MRSIRLWLGALICTSALPLQAQSPGSIEVSPFVGYLFGGATLASLADHTSYGLRLGYATRKGLEPELEWLGVDTKLQFQGRVPRSTTLPVRMDFYLAGLTYNLTSKPVIPYLSLAAGAARLSGAGDVSVRFTGKLGLGVKALVTPWLGLRLEADGYATRPGEQDFGLTCTSFIQSGGVTVPVSCARNWLFDGNLGAGLVFAF